MLEFEIAVPRLLATARAWYSSGSNDSGSRTYVERLSEGDGVSRNGEAGAMAAGSRVGGHAFSGKCWLC